MAPTQPQSWRKVGWTSQLRPRRVYQALVPLSCHNCHRSIRPGDLFTRPRLSKHSNLRILACRQCLPFEIAPHPHASSNDGAEPLSMDVH